MRAAGVAFAAGLAALLASCGAARYPLNPDELARFMAAGPIIPELDREALLRGVPVPGPYRLGVGDLLEIHTPRGSLVPRADGAGAPTTDVHVARVDARGQIHVPLAGAIEAKGRILLEVEGAIVDAVHPKFLVVRPSIVVRLTEPNRVPVTILGAVEQPGIHELRTDQLSLYGALSAAGGILKSNNLVVGARRIRVRKPGVSDSDDIVLPVKGLNVPFSDVALAGGETIEVERYEPDTFTVVGLVTKPGAYEYPPEVTYNLMQALAIAGGVDTIADPPYATVFRKDAQGAVLPATFAIAGTGLVEASALPIKPGDVIVIEHTAASWTRSLLGQILRIQFGFFVDQRGN
jgi:protein involved in polysaccharide export with SLBB domain